MPTIQQDKFKIGQGFDIHKFDQNSMNASSLILGGVHISDHPKLQGHSDGDVLAHAISDALLGAAGLGDLGKYFPDTDPKWANADSMELLCSVVAMLRQAGWEPVNIDCTVIAQTPNLTPYKPLMAEQLSQACSTEVNVKGTSPETMGSLGSKEGIACLAIVLIKPIR
ncbi:MAG: 2-C-methyl-D-erythritol 2,4-cyclodiphosphate synthase [Actinobacteria bacterium]|jgi:2-C-methyl-D-erythritol 2,4-cyclodiphosphate synthase|nr:2-C-methyl-D-erythritol 2,4-cyclodiphosphate synthase [Actinomycetota bacterium]MCL6104870.1 2-C-methyl-D-erythritol 2,4-cyclodiphosphate synthase [Actinomycetota bacterium]